MKIKIIRRCIKYANILDESFKNIVGVDDD
jgi:hypothetical protein